MKLLYTERGGYTVEASNLDTEIYNAVKSIFEKYLAEGYSIREIGHIAGGAVRGLECEMALDLRLKKG